MKKNGVSVIIWITIATFLGKVLGVVRDILISYYYGSTDMTDAFFLAMSIPTIILGIFTASTDSAIIPQYNRVSTVESRQRADTLFSSIVNNLLLICVIVSILIFLFPEIFIKIFAMGFEKEAIQYGINYLKIFAPLGVLHMLYCFFCTYNAVYKENKVRTILAFSTNSIVVSSLILCQDNNLISLSIAFLVSNVFCAFLPMLQSYKLGYCHRWKIDTGDVEFFKFWKLFLPIMGCALLNDIQQYVDKNLGSNIYGGISSLNYASKLINVFDSIFVVGISVVLLPMLSDLEIRKKKNEFRKITTRVTKYLLEILVPCFALLSSLTIEATSIIYGRGKFGQSEIEIVSLILKTYAPLVMLTPIQTVFSRFFHALEKNSIPFRLNLISVGMNILLSVILMNIFGLQGISFATTIATSITLIAYTVIIWRKIGWDQEEMSIKLLVGIVMATIISWIGVFIIKKFIISQWIIIIISALMVSIIFSGTYFITARQDIQLLFGLLNELKKKKSRR